MAARAQRGPGAARSRATIRRVASGVARHASRDRILVSASSLAFHWFIAIVPGAIAIIGLTRHSGLSTARLESLAHDLSTLLPASASKVFDQALSAKTTASSLATILLAALVSLWSGIESTATLQVALDMAYETNGDRGFIARRIRGLPLFLVTLVLGGGAFALLVIGAPLGSLIEPKGGAGWFTPVWTAARWIVGIACVVLLISLYDLLGPSRTERRWRLVTVGSGISTVLWLIFATCYSLYLDHFGHSTETYGSLAGVVALLLWLYLAGTVVLIGAEVNREIESPSTDAEASREVRGERSRVTERHDRSDR